VSKRALAFIAVVLSSLGVIAGPSLANDHRGSSAGGSGRSPAPRPPVAASSDGRSGTLTLSTPGGEALVTRPSAGRQGRPGPTWRCYYMEPFDVGEGGGFGALASSDVRAESLTPGTGYFIRCYDERGDLVDQTPGDPYTTDRLWINSPGGPGPLDGVPEVAIILAVEELAETVAPAPLVGISPRGRQLVGVPTWVWVDGGVGPVDATTAPLPGGVTATIRATPRVGGASMVFDPGTGDSPVSCTAPGLAWDGHAEDDPRGCRYTYQGRLPEGASPTLTVHYDLAWWVNETSDPLYAGLGGVLPGISGSSPVAITVKGTQAVRTG
jgi:hypothetical protein